MSAPTYDETLKILNSMSNWDWASNANATAYHTSMVAMETVTRSARTLDFASNAASFSSNHVAFASNIAAALQASVHDTSSHVSFASNAIAAHALHWTWGSNMAAHAYYVGAMASNVASHANRMSELAWYRSAWASNIASDAIDHASDLVGSASNWDWGSNAAYFASNTSGHTLKILENQVLLIAKLQQTVLDLEAKVASLQQPPTPAPA